MSIRRHTLQNLAGTLVPMLVSIAVVPVYLHLIGPARYGVLTIVWLFLGYFGIFDLGLARTTSFHMAKLHDAGPAARASVFYTALAVNVTFGLLGAAVFMALARPVFVHVFHLGGAGLGGDLGAQVLAVLPWLAAAVPMATVTSVMVGTLHARERFGAASFCNVFNVLATQLAPLAVAVWGGPDLGWLIKAIVLARLGGFLLYVRAVWQAVPLGQGGGVERGKLRAFFNYGGWIFVSNLLEPVLTAMDRMLVGSLLGAAAVTYYSVPFNLVAKISSLAVALPASLFPKMSRSDEAGRARLAADSLLVMAAVLTPVVVGVIGALPVFLKLWLGPAFAEIAAPVGLALLPGVWMNSLAYIVYGQLQAANRPDLTAKFHVAELLPFLGILWLGLHYFGLVGAAVAWSLRVSLDAGLLLGATRQWLVAARLAPGAVLVLLATMAAPRLVFSIQTILVLGVLALACGWALVVAPELRRWLRQRLAMLFAVA